MERRHIVTFLGSRTVNVPSGTLLTDAAALAGEEILQPCGGQGRCGRCTVKIERGRVRRRSTLRLSPEDIALGYALACQSVVEGNVTITIPKQETIKRRLVTDRTVPDFALPPHYDPALAQPLRRVTLTLTPPDMSDQTDDWSRVQTALRAATGAGDYLVSLKQLQHLGPTLREGDWQITVLLEMDTWDRPNGPPRVIKFWPGHVPPDEPLLGAAIDIGTTTVSLLLVDLISGKIVARAAEYNGQIARGEDVISRIIYASKNGGAVELRDLVLGTIETLLQAACAQAGAQAREVLKATVAGNSTMIHLLLNLPAETIRLSPFVTGINHLPSFTAREVGLAIWPEATVDCLPGVASYVGSDITAGVLAAGLEDADATALFLDIGTNGEIVLGNRDWLATCACSAGPAFEGAGVMDGMRATTGAIEEVWINSATHEPTYRVIGGGKPRGLCGSGLIALLAEMFITGTMDKAGHVKLDLPTNRVRTGEHGPEYVVAWASETAHGRDIVITNVDIDNLLRAKAAIYAGYSVLAESVGVPLETVEHVLIGGAFGQYLNVEKAVQIGLLPDLPWENFRFLGNTSVQGAYYALIDRASRLRIREIANRMTYIELSADNRFYEAFMSALFLPHTDLTRFPSVEAAMTP